jgi:hypothetical protein
MNKNPDLKKALDEIDLFEKKFKTNSQDESLMPYLQETFNRIKERNFNKKELAEIQSRLMPFRQMFDEKKQQLKEQSSKLLKTKDQLKRYLTNSNIKNNK